MGYDLITHLIGHELAGPSVALVARDACQGAILVQKKDFWRKLLMKAKKDGFKELPKQKQAQWISEVAKSQPTLTIEGGVVDCPL